MLVLSFYTLKELRPSTSKYILYPLLISYCLFSQYFAIFFLTFTGLQLLIAKYARKKINMKNKKYIFLYFISFITGTFCWLLDQFCKTKYGGVLEPFQFHAWWHILTASAMGFGYYALKDQSQSISESNSSSSESLPVHSSSSLSEISCLQFIVLSSTESSTINPVRLALEAHSL